MYLFNFQTKRTLMNNNNKIIAWACILLASSYAQAMKQQEDNNNNLKALCTNFLQVHKIMQSGSDTDTIKSVLEGKLQAIKVLSQSEATDKNELQPKSTVSKVEKEVLKAGGKYITTWFDHRSYTLSKKKRKNNNPKSFSYPTEHNSESCPHCQGKGMAHYVIDQAPLLLFLECCSLSDVEGADNEGNTCLHAAARLRDPIMLTTLIQKGVSLIVTNKKNENVLHVAVSPGGSTTKFLNNSQLTRLPEVKSRSGITKCILDQLRPVDLVQVLMAKSTLGKTPLLQALETAWQASQFKSDASIDFSVLVNSGGKNVKNLKQVIEETDPYTDATKAFRLLVSAYKKHGDTTQWDSALSDARQWFNERVEEYQTKKKTLEGQVTEHEEQEKALEGKAQKEARWQKDKAKDSLVSLEKNYGRRVEDLKKLLQEIQKK